MVQTGWFLRVSVICMAVGARQIKPIPEKGPDSSTEYELCRHLHLCWNGGTCQPKKSFYSCSCVHGFEGDNCELVDICYPDPCVNGYCINLLTHYECVCNTGYVGQNCTLLKNQCLSSPCENGGVCEGETNSFRCKCLSGFSGKTCEKAPPSTPKKIDVIG